MDYTLDQPQAESNSTVAPGTTELDQAMSEPDTSSTILGIFDVIDVVCSKDRGVSVLKVRNNENSQLFALKVFPESMINEFETEVEVNNRLSLHPKILRGVRAGWKHADSETTTIKGHMHS